jgi:hypothetical protein
MEFGEEQHNGDASLPMGLRCVERLGSWKP